MRLEIVSFASLPQIHQIIQGAGLFGERGRPELCSPAPA